MKKNNVLELKTQSTNTLIEDNLTNRGMHLTPPTTICSIHTYGEISCKF